jgi:chemotaxis response regulator CheB
MARRDIIVIGGSAGSFKAFKELLCLLPAGLEAAIFVVNHRSTLQRADHFPSLLGRQAALETSFAVDHQAFQAGHIYVGPPGAWLTIDGDEVRVQPAVATPAPKNIDVLFKSAALACGERVIGVVLSGLMNDGSAGCWEIRKHGGVTIAQDPGETDYSSMPTSAMRDVPVHYCLTASEIAAKLIDLVKGTASPAVSLNARVMIVEDEWMLASELERQLADLHYTPVATIASGEEALERAESAMPDLVIMDVGLAGKMKGTEAAARLWQRYQLPIIFLTAHADQQTIAEAQPSMPYGYLAKPHHAGQLHAAIQLALARHHQEIARHH